MVVMKRDQDKQLSGGTWQYGSVSCLSVLPLNSNLRVQLISSNTLPRALQLSTGLALGTAYL